MRRDREHSHDNDESEQKPSGALPHQDKIGTDELIEHLAAGNNGRSMTEPSCGVTASVERHRSPRCLRGHAAGMSHRRRTSLRMARK